MKASSASILPLSYTYLIVLNFVNLKTPSFEIFWKMLHTQEMIWKMQNLIFPQISFSFLLNAHSREGRRKFRIRHFVETLLKCFEDSKLELTFLDFSVKSDN